jgi:hypothetical protein
VTAPGRIDRSTIAASALVGLTALIVARATLLPDVGLWDTGEAQTVPPLLGTMHPTGFPLYSIVGFVMSAVTGPFAAPALAMNLLSAVCLAVTAAAAVALSMLLTGRLAIAVATGMGVAVTPAVWALGVRADVHALHVALVALLLVALVGWERARSVDSSRADRWLLVAAALGGLALANHRLTLLLGPGIALYALVVEPAIVRRPRLIAACLGLSLGLAASLYLQLPLRAGPWPAPLVYGHPDTWTGFWQIVLGTQFGGALAGSARDPVAALSFVVTTSERQLGALALLVLPALALTVYRRPRYALLTVPTVVATIAFATVYQNAAIERYWAVPTLLAWTWLAIGASTLADLAGGGTREAAGFREAAGSREAAASRGMGARSLGAVGVGVIAAILLLPTGIELAGRWRAVDASGEDTGRRWLEAALEALPTDAVVASWWAYSTPLWYGQHIEGRRTDIWVVDDRTRLDDGLGAVTDVIDANLGRRPVFLVRVDQSEVDAILERYAVTVVDMPVGQDLLRVDGRLGGD